MERGPWRTAAPALAHPALADPRAHVPVTAATAMLAATVRAQRNRRDRNMALLRASLERAKGGVGEAGRVLDGSTTRWAAGSPLSNRPPSWGRAAPAPASLVGLPPPPTRPRSPAPG